MRSPKLLAVFEALKRRPHGGTDAFPKGHEVARKHCMDEAKIQNPPRTLAELHRGYAPETESAFREFSRRVFADGALPADTKQLIAVAVAHVTQCPDCIRGYTRAAQRNGATPEEIMEAIWVAAEMRAGAAFAHSNIALEALRDE
jgi:AhpD family alkylhydroperoxidase